MTAPSIKEALELKPCPFCGTAPAFGRMIEPDQVTIGCNNDGCLVQLCVVSDVESEAVKAWNTRATLQPSGERGEAIARIIDPEAFANWERTEGNWRKDKARAACWPALEKAEVILASGLVQDEAGIRASQREIDAKIADKEAAYLLVTGARLRSYTQAATKLAYTEVDLHEQAGTAIKSVVAAIRSARNGGAS